MASHRTEELRTAARTLAKAARAAGFEPRARAELAPVRVELVEEPIRAASAPPPPRVFDFEAPERIARAA
jgi:phage terminase small subunit